jgi:SSS family solute:Na+ symporter
LPAAYDAFKSVLHINMVIVVGTLTIFLTGVLLTAFKKNKNLEKN